MWWRLFFFFAVSLLSILIWRKVAELTGKGNQQRGKRTMAVVLTVLVVLLILLLIFFFVWFMLGDNIHK